MIVSSENIPSRIKNADVVTKNYVKSMYQGFCKTNNSIRPIAKILSLFHMKIYRVKGLQLYQILRILHSHVLREIFFLFPSFTRFCEFSTSLICSQGDFFLFPQSDICFLRQHAILVHTKPYHARENFKICGLKVT